MTWSSKASTKGLSDEVHVLYVSPLKALSNDIQKNLQEPLAGIRDQLLELGLRRRADPRRGAHRRHLDLRAQPDAQVPAAHPGHDAGVALHPADLRIRPRDAEERQERDRGRAALGRRQQARLAPDALARAAGGALRQAARARRPLGDGEAARCDGALPGRQPRGRRRDRGHRPRARAGPRARARRARRSRRSWRTRSGTSCTNGSRN